MSALLSTVRFRPRDFVAASVHADGDGSVGVSATLVQFCPGIAVETFVFDMDGTLVGNHRLDPKRAQRVLQRLRRWGHRVILWTCASQLAFVWRELGLADDVWIKEESWGKLAELAELGRCWVVDDDPRVLMAAKRLLPECTVVSSYELAGWLNEWEI